MNVRNESSNRGHQKIISLRGKPAIFLFSISSFNLHNACDRRAVRVGRGGGRGQRENHSCGGGKLISLPVFSGRNPGMCWGGKQATCLLQRFLSSHIHCPIQSESKIDKGSCILTFIRRCLLFHLPLLIIEVLLFRESSKNVFAIKIIITFFSLKTTHNLLRVHILLLFSQQT